MMYEDKPDIEEVYDELMHYGMPRRSGRYPWGSGKEPYQHSEDFLGRVEQLKKEGLSDTQIAKQLELSTTEYRVQYALATDERRDILVKRAKALQEDGLNPTQIAREMGYKNESSVRSLLNANAESRMKQAKNTAEFLKSQVDSKGMIDVGTGTELSSQIRVSKEKMNQALYILQREGYEVYSGRVEQATNRGKWTTVKVLCPPGTPYKNIYKSEDVHSIDDYVSQDNGETFRKAFQYPKSMDSKRLKIRYTEDGGLAKDGLIELRRGVDDLSLGESTYAQVRILVDDTHYIKGMAVYSDNMPDGVDVVFNTNKSKDVPVFGPKNNSVLKPISTKDPDNPFGSLIKEKGGQYTYTDKNGVEQLSLINKRAEEGDWGAWAKELSSQFLSKQSVPLIKKQLSESIASKKEELADIMKLNNPVVKKRFLESFADDCDANSVDLKAAALPAQRYQVIIPLTSVKDNEIYAPNYKDGTQVALVRYPHGGTFEIPILTVNNKNKEGINILTKTPSDAVGINKKVADRLSGADFDGDTVMVIPTGRGVNIASRPPLKGLEGFDPSIEYGGKPEGTYHRMTKTETQKEMGIISNLITDMTIIGATDSELAAAVKHSMVVIDAEKHGYDYKQSEKDNNIAALKKKYQIQPQADGTVKYGGAATLISRAKSKEVVPERKEGAWILEDGRSVSEEEYKALREKDPSIKKKTVYIDPNTGEKLYRNTDRVYEEYDSKTKKFTGKIKEATMNSTKMAETNDAFTLVSETRSNKELLYAEYANTLKGLANEARKATLTVGSLDYDPHAKKMYSKEVEHLNAELTIAKMNAPKERQAQLITNSKINALKKEYPDITKEEIKKRSQQELSKARKLVGAERHPIKITDDEWKAIQAGAISGSKLTEIVQFADLDDLRQKASPNKQKKITTTQQNKIKAMFANDFTYAEIAEATNLSVSTIQSILKPKKEGD